MSERTKRWVQWAIVGLLWAAGAAQLVGELKRTMPDNWALFTGFAMLMCGGALYDMLLRRRE